MIAYISGFFKEVQTDSASFLVFCKKEKGLRWFTAFSILIFWGIKIVNNDIFIDSEIMSLEPYGLLQSWYGSKRFGLILTKKIFHYVRLVPYLSNLLFAGALWGVLLFLCFCLERWFFSGSTREKKWGLYILAGLFVTAPSLAEQYSYTLQAFEITMAMGFCLIAAYCADQAVCGKKSLLWYCPALFFLVWSLGSYQAFCSFYIALILISFLGSYERQNSRSHLKDGALHFSLFIFGLFLYTVTGNLLCLIKSGDSAYVEGMFLWGRIPFTQCIQYIQNEFQLLFCGLAPVLYNQLAGVVFVLSAIGLAARSIRKKWKQTLWYWLALLLLAASPMYVSLLTGMRTPIRGQLVFPLVFSFFAVALWHMLIELLRTVFCPGNGPHRALCALLTAFFFAQAWIQGTNLIQLNQTQHDTYIHDILTAERIYMDICRVADQSDMQNRRVVFVGTRDARMPQAALLGESIGHSFFDFGITSIGVTNRVTGLLNYLGMNVGGATPDDYTAALKAAEEKPCWPAQDSVFELNNGCIAVKLSD